jgi:hypothetical protein
MAACTVVARGHPSQGDAKHRPETHRWRDAPQRMRFGEDADMIPTKETLTWFRSSLDEFAATMKRIFEPPHEGERP